MSRLREKAELIMKYGDSVIAEKQRKTAVIKRTAYSVSGICAAAGITFSIWNNDAIKNSADFNKYNSSSVVDNPTESGTFTISSESTVETTTSTVADITVNSAETSEITTAEPPHTQETAVSDTTTKKTSAAIRTTAAYTQNTATITETQLAGNVTVTNTQTTEKTTTMPIATNDEPTTMATTTKTEPTAIDKTLSRPASEATLPIQCTATVTSQSISTATSIPLSSNPAASIPNNSTTDSSISTFTTTVSDTGTTVTSISEPFTSVTTATGGNSNTTPVLELIISDKGELTDILYDGVIYHNALSKVDTAYLERDKRKYLGDVYYNRIGYCSVYYVYDYKEQGKPALVLAAYKSNISRLFLME